MPLLKRSQDAPPTGSTNVGQLEAKLNTWGAHPTEHTLACHAEFLSAVVEGQPVVCKAFPKGRAVDVDGLVDVAEQLEASHPEAALKIIALVLLACPASRPGLERCLVEKGTALLGDGKVHIERELGHQLHDHVAVDGHFEVIDAGLVKQFLHALEEKLPAVCKPVAQIELRSETLMKVVDNLGLCLEPGDDDGGMSPAEAAERLTKAFRAGVELDHREAAENCLFWLNSGPPEAGDAHLADCRAFQREASGFAAVDRARVAMESSGWELSTPPGGWQWQLTLRAPAACLETVVDYAAVCMQRPQLLPPGQMKAVCTFLQGCGLDVVDQWQRFMRSPWDSDGLPALLDQIDGDLQRAADSGRCWSAHRLTPLRRFVCEQAAQAGCSPQLEARLFGMWCRLVRLPQEDFVVDVAQEARAWSGRRLECRNLLKELCGPYDAFVSGLLWNLMDRISFSAAALVAQRAPRNRSWMPSPLRIPVLAALLHDEWSANPGMDMQAAVRLLVRCLPEGHESAQSFATILAPVLSQCPRDTMEALLHGLAPELNVPDFAVPADATDAAWSAGLLPDFAGDLREPPAQAEVDSQLDISGAETHFQSKLPLGPDRRFELMAVALVSLMAKGHDEWSQHCVTGFIQLADDVSGWYPDTDYARLLKAAIVMEVVDCCGTGAMRQGLCQLVVDLLNEFKSMPTPMTPVQGLDVVRFSHGNGTWARDLKQRVRAAASTLNQG
ncbi:MULTISPECIES: hypothetical protein [unclassified Rhizobacter]|uniref:hypothetical protein n=1 Tax=unclassified Rhizobacter TaxID=2640088 RepID=UPI0012F95979|nr:MULTISPECIES: hypothetical protein [unclassified Rhizobacter]